MIKLIEKKNNLLDSAGLAILPFTKEQLTEQARALKSKLNPLLEKQILLKLQHLIESRLEWIKDFAKEDFIEKFDGSASEKENGFQMSLKTTNEYEYSEDVKDLETEINLLKEQLRQMKETERKKDIAKVVKSNEVLAFTLK